MRILFNWLCLIIIIAILLMAASCTTSKQSQSHTVTYDSTYAQSLLDSNRLLKIDNERLSQELRESQSATAEFDSTGCPTIFLPDCPGMMNEDSVRRLVNDLNNALSGANNKVKRFADGSVELQGRIRSVSYAAEKTSKLVIDKNRVIDSLTKKLAEKTVTVTDTVTTTSSKKKTTFFNWLFWLCLGFASATVLLKGKSILSIFKPTK